MLKEFGTVCKLFESIWLIKVRKEVYRSVPVCQCSLPIRVYRLSDLLQKSLRLLSFCFICHVGLHKSKECREHGRLFNILQQYFKVKLFPLHHQSCAKLVKTAISLQLVYNSVLSADLQQVFVSWKSAFTNHGLRENVPKLSSCPAAPVPQGSKRVKNCTACLPCFSN